jgi:hypothetical protein
MVPENSEITFTLNGRLYRLTRKAVVRSVEGWEPSRIHKYSVRIGRRSFPIKQVLGLAIDTRPIEFTAQDAYRILRRLAFEIDEAR